MGVEWDLGLTIDHALGFEAFLAVTYEAARTHHPVLP